MKKSQGKYRVFQIRLDDEDIKMLKDIQSIHKFKPSKSEIIRDLIFQEWLDTVKPRKGVGMSAKHK